MIEIDLGNLWQLKPGGGYLPASKILTPPPPTNPVPEVPADPSLPLTGDPQATAYGELVPGPIPYRVVDSNRVFIRFGHLKGPNGTQGKVEILRGLGNEIGSAKYYFQMAPGERCFAATSTLTSILVRVTDNAGGTRLVEQPFGHTPRSVDAYGDKLINGKGEWFYIRAVPGEVRDLQIVVRLGKSQDYPRDANGVADTTKPKSEVLPGQWGRVRCEWVQFEGPAATLETKVYESVEAHTGQVTKVMNNKVTIPAGIGNGKRIGWRVKTTFPDQPTWPASYTSYYYMENVTQHAPAAAQTFPKAQVMWPAGSWVTTPAAAVPYAKAGTKTLTIWGSQSVTTMYSESEQRAAFVKQMKDFNGGLGATTREFAAAVYVVDASTPRYDVGWVDYWNNGWGGGPNDPVVSGYAGVPVPDGATPALGTDGHIGFYEPATDRYWEFWQWHRDHDGKFWAASGGRSDGLVKQAGQLKSQGQTFTVSASGLACAATTIKASEATEALAKYDKNNQAAWDDAIGHVLTAGAPYNRYAVICWPAQNTDGNNRNDPTSMIEGQRFSIDPSLDLTKIAWRTPGEHILCRAVQKYGVMIVDTGGAIQASFQSAVAWQLATGTDPYASMFYGINDRPKQWNFTELIPETAWRVHQHFKDEAEWKAAVTPAPTAPPTPVSVEQQRFVPFTASNGASATYHVWSGRNVGDPVMIWLHGDAAYEHTNPDSTHVFAGSGGVVKACVDRGITVVSALTPDVSGAKTWWEDSSRNVTYLADLIAKVKTDLQPSRIYLGGYSGGAQFATQYFIPQKSAMLGSGGSMVYGGGGKPVTPSSPTFTSTFKSSWWMDWTTGADDIAANSDENYDGLAYAQAGANWYRAAGFEVGTSWPAGIDHDTSTLFGGWVAGSLDRHPGR